MKCSRAHYMCHKARGYQCWLCDYYDAMKAESKAEKRILELEKQLLQLKEKNE